MFSENTNKGYEDIDVAATGDLIYQRMQNRGMEIRDMSNALGVSFQAVHGYIHGYRLPSIPHLYAMSKILKTAMEDLLVMRY